MGSVPAEMDDSKEMHRVHFDENKDLVGKDNEITVHKKDGKLDVHLGFLQVDHRYKIAFSIPRTLCQPSDDSKLFPIPTESHNPHLQIISVTGSKDTLDFQLELFAHKEKLMIEEFSFRFSDSQDPITVLLNARVLGKGKGTPLLKNEIHIIHSPAHEESDGSSD